jgi:hypothetical protein
VGAIGDAMNLPRRKDRVQVYALDRIFREEGEESGTSFTIFIFTIKAL